jgi:hypothetical protein
MRWSQVLAGWFASSSKHEEGEMTAEDYYFL